MSQTTKNSTKTRLYQARCLAHSVVDQGCRHHPEVKFVSPGTNDAIEAPTVTPTMITDRSLSKKTLMSFKAASSCKLGRPCSGTKVGQFSSFLSIGSQPSHHS